jgi:hypothetical protein
MIMTTPVTKIPKHEPKNAPKNCFISVYLIIY